MHSFQSPWTFHWLHFQLTVSWFFLYALFLPTILNQTPSLCPFRADAVFKQIQIRQSRVLFEAFGQGLTGEIWTLSAALELIKLWVLSVLPSENLSSRGMKDEA